MTDTRERILDETAQLFRRHGYTGTSLAQVVAAADAAFGSLYHYFPGGKRDLAAATIRSAGPMYAELFDAVVAATPDLVSAVRHFFLGAADTLAATDFADACPIATIALEVASSDETLREATAEVFTGWIDAATRHFVSAGIDAAEARRLAVGLIGALEGAFVLSRSLRSIEPLEIAADQSAAAVRRALTYA